MSDVEKNVQAVRRLNELVNARDFDAMDALFSPAFVDHNASRDITGVQGVKQMLQMVQENFDIRNTILETVAAEDKVAIRVLSAGKHVKEAFGVAPSGKEMTCMNFEIYRFENGKIAERWVLSDIMGLLRQMGVKLPF